MGLGDFVDGVGEVAGDGVEWAGDKAADGLKAVGADSASEAVRDGLRSMGAGAGPVDVFGLARQADASELPPGPTAVARAGEVS